MSSVEKRTRNNVTRYYARWRDPEGKQRVKVFDKRGDAQRHLARTEVSSQTGGHIDAKHGRTTLTEYFDEWAERKISAPQTVRAAARDRHLHLQGRSARAYPSFPP